MTCGWETVGGTLGQEDTKLSPQMKRNSGLLGKLHLSKISGKSKGFSLNINLWLMYVSGHKISMVSNIS